MLIHGTHGLTNLVEDGASEQGLPSSHYRCFQLGIESGTLSSADQRAREAESRAVIRCSTGRIFIQISVDVTDTAHHFHKH